MDITKTVRLDQGLSEQVCEIAEQEERSFSYVVRKALERLVSERGEKVITPKSNKTARAEKIPYQEIVDLYHKILPELKGVKEITSKRKSQIKARWMDKQLDSLDIWERYFRFIRKSDWLMGKVPPSQGRRQFLGSLEWITNESNYAKITEKEYHGKKDGQVRR